MRVTGIGHDHVMVPRPFAWHFLDGAVYPQAFRPRFSSLAQMSGSLARTLRRRSHYRSMSRPTANAVNLPRACPGSLRWSVVEWGRLGRPRTSVKDRFNDVVAAL